MGLGQALLVNTETRTIGPLCWERTHLVLIRSAEPQVYLGPWSWNIPDNSANMATEERQAGTEID